MANIMNNFFINKVLNICANLPTIISDPLKTRMKLLRNRTYTFYTQSCEVRKVILGMTNSQSSGMDEILKLVLGEILQAATHIVDLSFEAKEFTSIWKVSMVIPLPLWFTLVLSHFPTQPNRASQSVPLAQNPDMKATLKCATSSTRQVKYKCAKWLMRKSYLDL